MEVRIMFWSKKTMLKDKDVRRSHRRVAGAKFPISFWLEKGGKEMKNIVLACVVAFAFCPMVMASDIAFYVGGYDLGWYGDEQFGHVETIIAETGHLFKDIQQFDDTQFDVFGAWVDERTNDGTMDIIWLNGYLPSVLYPYVNLEPDGSRAEEWLDGGNMIINVGDWFAYVSYETGSRQPPNGPMGVVNILDLSEIGVTHNSGVIVMGNGTQLTVTSTGKEYLPSLNDPARTDRPVILSAVQAPWEVAAIFASSGGTDDAAVEAQADPVVIHNTETGGYVAFINQAWGGPAGWIDDRGLTCAEFIGNWVNSVIGLGDPPLARRPNPRDGAQYETTWASLAWTTGDFAVSHDVYMSDNFDDVNDGAAAAFQGNQVLPFFTVGFPGFPYPDGLVPGTTYYWRIDEVDDADPNSPWKGDVWSFWIPPNEAYAPSPSDGEQYVVPVVTLNWTEGLDAKLHTVYFGDNFDEVNNASGGVSQSETTFTPEALEIDKTYYWRVDEFDAINTYRGDVWSFNTLPVMTIDDPNLIGWWKFDEGNGGTVIDYSGYGNHGKFGGDPWRVEGIIDGALVLDGDDYVTIDGVVDDITSTNITLSIWIKSMQNSQGDVFAANDSASSHPLEFYIEDRYPGRYDGSDIIYTAAPLVVDAQWHMMTYVREGNTCYIYVDGIQVATDSASFDLSAVTRWSIGQEWDGSTPSNFYFGLVDDARFYNTSLSAEEIAALAQ